MATSSNPQAAGLAPAPAISTKTIYISGLLVDIHGLSELDPSATHASILWLHHPRGGRRENMAYTAARCVAAWNSKRGRGADRRGLLAAAFDQRNHGSRTVHPPANEAWKQGNGTHALDMFATVRGAAADQAGLLDLVEAYLARERAGGLTVDQHLALGVSLGGHSVWQVMFSEPRICAGVVVVGCPDYTSLLSDRARLSKLPTYSAADHGASFLGSEDFPPALIEACMRFDPKAICFGAEPVPPPGPPPEPERRRLEAILDERVRGKRFLLCSGGADKVVPYACGEAFVEWFANAAETWFGDGGVRVDDRIYPGTGHVFCPEMVDDAVEFVLGVVSDADKLGVPPLARGQGSQAAARI